MADEDVSKLRLFLANCTVDEQRWLFKELRTANRIHQLEDAFGAPAEVILEAIHRAPELTRRMLRGVIADAAFALSVVPMLEEQGWKDVTPIGNFSFDHLLEDAQGKIAIQVKLQRSENLRPLITTGKRFGLAADMFMVEPQRTRGGTRRGVGKEAPDARTRPYLYGEFDVLAVSLQPSSRDWKAFRYTVGDWLLPGKNPNEIATYQPVARVPNDDWTDDFATVAAWVRSGVKKRISNQKHLPT